MPTKHIGGNLNFTRSLFSNQKLLTSFQKPGSTEQIVITYNSGEVHQLLPEFDTSSGNR